MGVGGWPACMQQSTVMKRWRGQISLDQIKDVVTGKERMCLKRNTSARGKIRFHQMMAYGNVWFLCDFLLNLKNVLSSWECRKYNNVLLMTAGLLLLFYLHTCLGGVCIDSTES